MMNMPKLLKFQHYKTGWEIGFWFASMLISFNITTALYAWVSNKYSNWLERRRFAKLRKEMEKLDVQNQLTVSDVQTAEAK